MPEIRIALSDEEYEQLRAYAKNQRRTPQAQAAYLTATACEAWSEDQTEPYIISGSALDPFRNVNPFHVDPPNPEQREEFVSAIVSADNLEAGSETPPRGRNFSIGR